MDLTAAETIRAIAHQSAADAPPLTEDQKRILASTLGGHRG